ncbi:MAG: 50S ribosomal protein L9 [Rhizobiales bacterium]|nr:50S ribosomal protein L9 [Hyphomicrobiales bacterium]
MEVILLERIAKLGNMGDTVSVKTGFARNYLLPQGKALRSNKANLAKFEAQRSDLEAKNLVQKTDAEGQAITLDGMTFVAIRQSSDSGQLYGSVTTRDIAALLKAAGVEVRKTQVHLPAPIKTLGLSDVIVALHPEVDSTIIINVARSEEEAEMQARGEDVTQRDDFDDEDEDGIEVEDVFEDAELAAEAESELSEEADDDAAEEVAVVAEEEATPEADEEAGEAEETAENND